MSITIIRPGTRILTVGSRGVRIMQPMGGAAPWFLSGGIAAANCLVAYQPKGAASLAASYINLANPGTYDAAPVVAPTWDTINGWIFNGTTQYLKIGAGLIPQNGYSMLIRYTNAAQNVAGVHDLPNGGFMHAAAYNTGHRWFYGSSEIVLAGTIISGVILLSPTYCYYNGVQDADVSAHTWTQPTIDIIIGGRHFEFYGGSEMYNLFVCKVQALAIYNTNVAAQQAALYTAMAAL